MAESNKQTIDELRQLNVLLEQQKTLALALGNLEQARAAQTEITANNEKIINELKNKGSDLTEEELKYLQQIQGVQKEINNEVDKEVKRRERLVKQVKFLNEQIKKGWEYLQASDKVIRQTILNLGMSGTKAELMRQSFEQSAGFVTRLGGTLEDISNITTTYADETGRARVMSAEMLKDITAIGKGTGLGVEQAARLGAQFELMGFDAKSTMDYVQGVVDASERMGVNTTKVLKNVNDNFKRLNTYTFQQGVKGFAQMAMYAEKFRIDINQALNAADVARSLEGAIDLAAQLQVMGGEFAKTDPFELLFLSRNDPAKFTEKIADMTKGVVTFRKMADGSFEKFISPADRDRLAAVAKSLGMEVSQLTQIAERQAEIGRMRQQMAGMGLSAKEKEIIEGAAIFNKETGRFEVQVAGHMKDIATLTEAQAKSFVKERASLEDRAKQAMTFDETFKATINSLKSALLPILHSVNGLLTKLQPIADWMSKFAGSSGGWIKAAGLLVGAAGIWKMVTFSFNKAVDNWVKTGSIWANKKTEPTTRLGKFLRGSASVAKEEGGAAGGAGGIGSKISGKALAGAGAGVGLAAAGVGAGIGAAAAGISLLAKAMSGLDEKKAETLKEIVSTIGWFTVGGIAAAAGIMAFSVAAGASAGPLLAFGGAIALIGAGIGIAAAGIGVMGMGLAKLVEAAKGAGPAMMQTGMGIGLVAASMAGFTAGALGFLVFSKTMQKISENAPALATVGESFKQINAVLSGKKEDFLAVQNAIESISKLNVKGGSIFADLANLLSKPLKVEFAEGRVAMVNDITLTIDNEKFMQKIYNVNLAVQKHENVRRGKGDLV